MSQALTYPKIALNPALGQQTMAASIPVVIASDQSAVAISAASLPLPTGAATEVTLAAMSLKLPATLGQKAMAASMAVTLASDQSALAVSQSGTWNINNISGTISLPTGAATEGTLSTMSLKLPATLGQKAMAASMAVTLASDQTALAVSATQLPASLGQKAMTASLPVVLASDQTVIPASQSGTWTVQPGNTANTTPWLVTQKSAGTLTDRSGSTSGTPSTSTQVAASNASRRYFFIENLDASNPIWINFTSSASAAAGSIKIVAGGAYVMEDGFCSTEAINVLAAVASVAFTAKEG